MLFSQGLVLCTKTLVYSFWISYEGGWSSFLSWGSYGSQTVTPRPGSGLTPLPVCQPSLYESFLSGIAWVSSEMKPKRTRCDGTNWRHEGLWASHSASLSFRISIWKLKMAPLPEVMVLDTTQRKICDRPSLDRYSRVVIYIVLSREIRNYEDSVVCSIAPFGHGESVQAH